MAALGLFGYAMREVKQTFVKSDGARRVEIFRRDDGTFGFEEMRFGAEERTWFPVGRYSTAVIDSLDNAIREARGRVSWLKDEAQQGDEPDSQ